MDDVDLGRLRHCHIAKGFWIETIEEQAGASQTTGFDEGSPIHKGDPERVKGTAQATPCFRPFQAGFGGFIFLVNQLMTMLL